TKGQQGLEIYAYLLPIVSLVFPLAFAVQGLYRIRPTRSKTEEWLAVAIGSVVATVVLSGVLLWIRPGNPDVLYSRATLGIFMICAMLLTIVGRARASSRFTSCPICCSSWCCARASKISTGCRRLIFPKLRSKGGAAS